MAVQVKVWAVDQPLNQDQGQILYQQIQVMISGLIFFIWVDFEFMII